MSLLPKPLSPPPVVWTIAGSDCCAGAGIQADLKTFTALGVHGCTVITSLTAQNSLSVTAVESVSVSMLDAQITALKNDMPPRVIKIGMLGDAAGVRMLARHLADLKTYTVCDPVMVASAGAALVGADIMLLMSRILFPLIDVLTPNIAETEILTGRKLQSDKDVELAAADIMALGVKAVVIKGWCVEGFAQDFCSTTEQSFWLTLPLHEGADPRGTGCTFASVLAAAHASGFSFADAAVIAKTYVSQSRHNSYAAGKGMPILAHKSWSPLPEDLPWLTATAAEGRQRPVFPDCGETPLGFYPVVDSVEWLEWLLPLGVTTAQLRIKNRDDVELENDIRRAIQLARCHDCRLFINDYWALAIKHGAYGVHLGQEDIATADMQAIASSGLRLGLSTHCYAEIARTHAFKPSYMAIGPIFPTTLKSMKFAPQGIDVFRAWRRLVDYPVVAIGGITLETALDLAKVGADGVAVVSDITKNPDPEKRAKAWLEFFSSRQNAKKPCDETEPRRRSA